MDLFSYITELDDCKKLKLLICDIFKILLSVCACVHLPSCPSVDWCFSSRITFRYNEALSQSDCLSSKLFRKQVYSKFESCVHTNASRSVSQYKPDAERLLTCFSQVQPGSVVALVGSSGAGKSTTFHLIENFYKPDQGQVRSSLICASAVLSVLRKLWN